MRLGSGFDFDIRPYFDPLTKVMTHGPASVRSNEARGGRQWFWNLLLHAKVALFETHQVIVALFRTRQATSSVAGVKIGNTENYDDVKIE